MQNLLHFRHSRKIILLFIIALYLFGVALVSKAQTVVVTAESIADGDTLTLRMSNGFTFNARLHGIDAPELSQPFGSEAKAHLTSLVYQQQLRAWIIAQDSFGRKLVHLLKIDYTNLNLAMIRSGFAWQDSTRKTDRKSFADAMDAARVEKIGIWSVYPADVSFGAPIPEHTIPCRPRKWRAIKCSAQL